MMTGLLILTLPYKQLSGMLSKVMHRACAKVNKVLYVHLDPAVASSSSSSSSPPLSLSRACSLVGNIYRQSSDVAPSLDVRVILAGFKGRSLIPVNTQHSVQVVMVDSFEQEHLAQFQNRYLSYLNGTKPVILLENDEDKEINGMKSVDEQLSSDNKSSKVYKKIVAGGTFDRIHCGHKILLSEGILRCSNKFTIGIADGPLLVRKTLCELIEPVDVRIKNLHALLKDMDPSLDYCLEPIYEPLGPSGTDPDMEMIIVSQETLKGGNYVNSARKERQLSVLDVEVIDLVEDLKRGEAEEDKVSSSSGRMRLLGTLLKQPDLSIEPNIPYMIGLTGGSASGKSSIAKHLSKLGANIIDCDKLGHKAYTKGTTCYQKLVDAYGPTILTEDKEINRKALGAQVFGCHEKLQALNALVWPEIVRLIQQEVELLNEGGAKVVVLDAAVLLEAGWDKLCKEVWVCLLPRSEAVRRICDRDGCPIEQAEQRLARQLSDTERLKRAHVALCSLWQPAYTARQVDTAWHRLQQQLGATSPRR